LSRLLAVAASVAALGASDPVLRAVESYEKVNTYRVTLRSKSPSSSEEILYYYKRPGFVRMEFIRPRGGAVLVYDPVEGKVRVRPFGFLKAFVIGLSPGNPLVRSARGHRVDASDIGALLDNVTKLQAGGKTVTLDEAPAEGLDARVVSVEGKDGFTVDGIHKYVLRLERESFLPLKVSAYGQDGELIEEVLMDDLETNVELPGALFKLD
jgi:outer membrane lipoprotein-sorting protein